MPKTLAPGHWLFKSEPDSYSIDDLARDKVTCWDGVRNYQARNFLRDEVRVGDRVFFYHSGAEPPAIAGVMEVVRAGYPDHTAFNPHDHHFDPKSKPESPTWYMVDVRWQESYSQPVTRTELADDKVAAEMMVLRIGSRLSIQPVTADEWKAVEALAKRKKRK